MKRRGPDLYRRRRRLLRRGAATVYLVGPNVGDRGGWVAGGRSEAAENRLIDAAGFDVSRIFPRSCVRKILRSLHSRRPVFVELFAIGRSGAPHLRDGWRRTGGRAVARRLEFVRVRGGSGTQGGGFVDFGKGAPVVLHGDLVRH